MPEMILYSKYLFRWNSQNLQKQTNEPNDILTARIINSNQEEIHGLSRHTQREYINHP